MSYNNEFYNLSKLHSYNINGDWDWDWIGDWAQSPLKIKIYFQNSGK